MTKQALTFSRKDSAKFFKTLNKRVNDYFKDNNLKRTGNWKLYLKAIFMFALWNGSTWVNSVSLIFLNALTSTW